MRRYKYVGPHDEVELQDLAGNVIGTVQRNHTIDVHDPEVADSLDEQDTWRHMPQRKPAAKRSSSKRKSRAKADGNAGTSDAGDQAGDSSDEE